MAATSRPDYLVSLSAAQLAAATHPATGALSISAPPGSGKTRVLTSRVAWLVREEKLMPEDVVVVTFTNKAANEMRHRLVRLIGADRTSRLVLGTFHAICARYLRRYGQLVDLPNSFSIMDADDARKVIKGILAELKEDLDAEGIKLKPEAVQGTISWSKAKGVSPAAYRASVSARSTSTNSGKAWRGADEETSSYKAIVATVYEMYTDKLRQSNALDFDDLLVFGVRLLSRSPHIVDHVRHVLVDEMQDTNTTQYELMSLFARATQCITTVGDPDQSVYGWRAAEVGNLDKMTREFKTEQAFLEENYRSTGSVLQAALAVIEQDRSRVQKGLFTSHPAGPPVTLYPAASPQHEASFIATEIKRLIAHSGGMLTYSDFAILLRYNALSREIEQALQTESIPSRMVGGSKFFDRMEIKDILAYLTLIVNPRYTPAFARAVNVPKRGIGDKSLADFLAQATDAGSSPMEYAEEVVDAALPAAGPKKKQKKGEKPPAPSTSAPAVKPTMRRGLTALVNAVRTLRSAAARGASVDRLVEIILDNVGYREHLQKEPDFESRLENVKELINFSEIALEAERTLGSFREGDEGGDDGQERAKREGSAEEGAVVEVVPEVFPEAGAAEEDASDVKPKAKTLAKMDKVKAEEAEEPSQSSTCKQGTKRSRVSSGPAPGQVKVEPIVISDDSDTESDGTTRPPSKKAAKAAPHPFFSRTVSGSSASGLALDEEALSAEGVPASSPLRLFLEACTLSTDLSPQSNSASASDGSAPANDADGPKVTISTCHAAKGLEYPVVFVPGVEEDIFPFFRCTKPHEVDEERRLLYVAMTRAQGVLYLSWCRGRMVRGEMTSKDLSSFVRPVVQRGSESTRDTGAGARKGSKKVAFGASRPHITQEHLATLATVLERTLPPQDEVQSRVRDFEGTRTADVIRSAAAAAAAGLGSGYSQGYGSGSFGGGFGSSPAFSSGFGGGSSFGGYGRASLGRTRPDPSPRRGRRDSFDYAEGDDEDLGLDSESANDVDAEPDFDGEDASGPFGGHGPPSFRSAGGLSDFSGSRRSMSTAARAGTTGAGFSSVLSIFGPPPGRSGSGSGSASGGSTSRAKVAPASAARTSSASTAGLGTAAAAAAARTSLSSGLGLGEEGVDLRPAPAPAPAPQRTGSSSKMIMGMLRHKPDPRFAGAGAGAGAGPALAPSSSSKPSKPGSSRGGSGGSGGGGGSSSSKHTPAPAPAPAPPVAPAPRYLDDYRLLSHDGNASREFLRPDGTAPRPRADLESFKSGNRALLDSFKALSGDGEGGGVEGAGGAAGSRPLRTGTSAGAPVAQGQGQGQAKGRTKSLGMMRRGFPPPASASASASASRSGSASASASTKATTTTTSAKPTRTRTEPLPQSESSSSSSRPR